MTSTVSPRPTTTPNTRAKTIASDRMMRADEYIGGLAPWLGLVRGLIRRAVPATARRAPFRLSEVTLAHDASDVALVEHLTQLLERVSWAGPFVALTEQRVVGGRDADDDRRPVVALTGEPDHDAL